MKRRSDEEIKSKYLPTKLSLLAFKNPPTQMRLLGELGGEESPQEILRAWAG
jgi:hypothetical protein